MIKSVDERIIMNYLMNNHNSIPEEVETSIRLLIQKVNNYTVEDIIEFLNLAEYVNLVDKHGHSINYCVKDKIPEELRNRYIRGIESESRSSIIIYIR